jgi:hypothetical protein
MDGSEAPGGAAREATGCQSVCCAQRGQGGPDSPRRMSTLLWQVQSDRY